MGSSSSNLQDKHVVIVGGGYGGNSAAKQLKGKCKITLIDPKEGFHHCIGSLRASVEKGYAKEIFIPYEPTFGDSFTRGTVVSIDRSGKSVKLDNGEEFTYDYLILATGSSGVFPAKLDLDVKDTSRGVELYNETVERINASQDIVIIGGGPVGVELAGEIAAGSKDKKVTLIHSRPALIDNGNFSDKFRSNLRDALETIGVEVWLEHRVSNLNELPRDGSERCKVQTDKGTEVEADLVFVCVGMKTNSAAYSQTFGDNLDKIGCLKVDQFLRVEGCTEVFAIGDCCTADAQAKMAFKAAFHAEVVAKNIQLLADGKDLKPYQPGSPLILVPIGRQGGVTQIGSMVGGDFVTNRFTSVRRLFISKYWGEMWPAN